MNSQSERTFRYDINALRTIAVSLVVLYHFHVAGFGSGFVGVDIFFVVSGYLMTKVIVVRIDAGSFSIWRFYGDRARRILPALTVVSLAVLLFGIAFLDPLTLGTIGQHVFSSVTFWSNMDYMFSGGYFDRASESKWLLHTWSLSVEWQFYLVYPIVIVIIGRFVDLRRWLLPAICLGAIASFTICLAVVSVKPTQTFYLLPTRAWEMLVGGIVAGIEQRFSLGRSQRNIAFWSGLTCIFFSNFIVDVNFWPSWPALLPTVGTALVIVANNTDARWLRNPLIVNLGKWSYSIYLWHWPPVAALVYFDIPFTPAIVLISIITVVMLSAVSYRYFEQWPQGQFRQSKQWHWYSALAGVVVLVGAMSIMTLFEDGWVKYRDERDTYEMLRMAREDWSAPYNCGLVLPPCQIGTGTSGGVAVWGDSHAAQWFDRVNTRKPSAAERVVFFTQFGCPPLPGINKVGRPACSDKFEKLFDLIKQGDFRRLLITSSWQEYLPVFPSGGDVPVCFETAKGCEKPKTKEEYEQGVNAAFGMLQARLQALPRQIQVVFLLDTPTPNFDVPLALAKRTLSPAIFGQQLPALDRSELERQSSFASGFIETLAQTLEASVVDPMNFVCEGSTCAVQDLGKPRYFDSSHITASAIRSDIYSFADRYFFRTKE